MNITLSTGLHSDASDIVPCAEINNMSINWRWENGRWSIKVVDQINSELDRNANVVSQSLLNLFGNHNRLHQDTWRRLELQSKSKKTLWLYHISVSIRLKIYLNLLHQQTVHEHHLYNPDGKIRETYLNFILCISMSFVVPPRYV